MRAQQSNLVKAVVSHKAKTRSRACAWCVTLAPIFVCVADVNAQVRPLRECSTLNQPIRVVVGPRPEPEQPAATSEVDAFAERPPAKMQTLLLLAPAADGRGPDVVLESRRVEVGEIDIASVFQRVWKTEDPRVLCIQAAEDEAGRQRIGPPLILVPMLLPRYAPRVDRTGAPQVNPLPAPTEGRTTTAAIRAFSGYWTFVDQHLVLDVGAGEMAFVLRADVAPMSVMHMRRLVASGFYDGVAVHRIASLSGQTAPDIVQFGDPTGTGLGGPGFMIDFEPSPLPHLFGTLSLARTSDPNSAGSQVFITLSNDVGATLNGRYAVFGRLASGADVLRAMAKSPTTADSRPREAIVIRSAKLVDAPPRPSTPAASDEPSGPSSSQPAR